MEFPASFYKPIVITIVITLAIKIKAVKYNRDSDEFSIVELTTYYKDSNISRNWKLTQHNFLKKCVTVTYIERLAVSIIISMYC